MPQNQCIRTTAMCSLRTRARQNRLLRRQTQKSMSGNCHPPNCVAHLQYRASNSSCTKYLICNSFNLYFGVIVDASVRRGPRSNFCLPPFHCPLACSPHAVTAKGSAPQQARACSYFLVMIHAVCVWGGRGGGGLQSRSQHQLGVPFDLPKST